MSAEGRLHTELDIPLPGAFGSRNGTTTSMFDSGSKLRGRNRTWIGDLIDVILLVD